MIVHGRFRCRRSSERLPTRALSQMDGSMDQIRSEMMIGSVNEVRDLVISTVYFDVRASVIKFIACVMHGWLQAVRSVANQLASWQAGYDRRFHLLSSPAKLSIPFMRESHTYT
jgi:hypothetical protein